MKNYLENFFKEQDYEKVFKTIVRKTEEYVTSGEIKKLVLGLSGGIDSTVMAAICREVSNNTDIPLVGRSLTIVNKEEEYSLAKKVGEAFCNDFKEESLFISYLKTYETFEEREGLGTKISRGNIMARLRMMYLYNIAGIERGIVMDTDNLTEHYLGFWTIHGDEGDYNPTGGLWKTEIYGLANWLCSEYSRLGMNEKSKAISESIAITPTDGNGVSSSDLEQIGGKSYFEVDKILCPIVVAGENIIEKLKNKGGYTNCKNSHEYSQLMKDTLNTLYQQGFDKETVDKIHDRYKNSEFKRNTSRTIKISRKELWEEIYC